MSKAGKKKKYIVLSLSIGIASLVVVFIGVSYFIGTQIVTASTQLVTPEDTTGVSDTFWDKHGVDYDAFCDKYTIESINITSSFDGHSIPFDFILMVFQQMICLICLQEQLQEEIIKIVHLSMNIKCNLILHV